MAAAATDQTILITVMAANNEVGTINPIAEIGKVAKGRQVLFHCDATQAVGKVPISVDEMGIDLLSLSGHKIYGPKGVGALYVRRRGPRVRLACQMHGGGHERGMRSGTLNVPGVVGMGRAREICAAEMAAEAGRLTALRDCDHVLDVRQRGLMAGIELCRDRRRREPLDPRLRTGAAICMAMRPKGLLVRPLGDVIVLMPVPAMPHACLHRMLDVVIETVREWGKKARRH